MIVKIEIKKYKSYIYTIYANKEKNIYYQLFYIIKQYLFSLKKDIEKINSLLKDKWNFLINKRMKNLNIRIIIKQKTINHIMFFYIFFKCDRFQT